MAEAMTRRTFLAATAAVGVGYAAGGAGAAERPALLGGKAARRGAYGAWPIIDEREEKALLEVLRSGKWFRYQGNAVAQFETAYAALTGAKHCIATTNGTSSLVAALAGVGVEPGDEVILSPYTFVATLNAVVLQYALPVFADSDLETFEVDATKIEPAITARTKALLPVHLGGNVANLDGILSVARKHKVAVAEDACQSHLAEWRGRKVGTWGDAGCFSFQASKNLNCGEGGAVLANDDAVAERAYAFHNNGRGPRGGLIEMRGSNLRMTEFQGALLLAQMARLEAQSRRREENAAYLAKMLEEIPGIRVAKQYEGCTRNAYHLFMFRYQKEQFANLPRSRFLQALSAEGVPCGGGYTPLNKEPTLLAALKGRTYQRLFPPEVLRDWVERNACPVNDRLCSEAVWLTQTMLLGDRSDMERMAEGVRKISKNAGELARG